MTKHNFDKTYTTLDLLSMIGMFFKRLLLQALGLTVLGRISLGFKLLSPLPISQISYTTAIDPLRAVSDKRASTRMLCSNGDIPASSMIDWHNEFNKRYETQVALSAPLGQSGTVKYLIDKAWTAGMAQAFADRKPYFLKHYIIADNSGSMSTSDSKILFSPPLIGNYFIPCTRFKEMMEDIDMQIALSSRIQIPTEVRFINDMGPLLFGAELSVANLEQNKRLLDSARPGGGTPLCEQLKQVEADIRANLNILKETKQKVAIIHRWAGY
jgi:hypothetical protein